MRRLLHFYHVSLFGVRLIFLLLRHFSPVSCVSIDSCHSARIAIWIKIDSSIWVEWFQINTLNCCTGVFLLPHSEWYLNGNYLVIIVSIAVILPLALMKQLGEYEHYQALLIIMRLFVSEISVFFSLFYLKFIWIWQRTLIYIPFLSMCQC